MIIGLTGKKRSGKDTSAQILQEYYETQNLKVERFAFAGPLKEAVRVIFFPELIEIKDDIKELPVKKYDNRTPRQMFQYIGDRCRDYDIDIFLKNMLTRINNSNADIKIVTDIRYDNEAQLVKNIGGTIIKIERETNSKDNHSSEMGIDSTFIDFSIQNNSDIEKLKKKLISFIVSK